MIAIDKLLRRDALLLRRLLHLLPVLIDAGEEKNVVAFQPVIAREHIGEHLLVSVADVRRAVGVVDGGGDEESGHVGAIRAEARRDGRARSGECSHGRPLRRFRK